MFKSASDHFLDVQLIQKELQNNAGKIDLKKSHISNTLRSGIYKKNKLKLNIASLNQIIEIDRDQKIAIVEPGVSMEALCAASLPYGLAPPVVTEFKSITVGGAIMGAAEESSSFKYGFFSDSCLAYQLLLASGTILDVSANQHADLFYGVAGSYGSLAILLQATLRLIPVKPYVQISCQYFDNSKEFLDALMETMDHADADYIDGVVFGRNAFLLMKGSNVEEPLSPLYQLEKPWSPWFIQQLMRQKVSFCLSLHDYLFRYDKAAFWMGGFIANWDTIKNLVLRKKNKSASGHDLRKILQSNPLNLAPNLLYRLILSGIVSSKKMYQSLHQISEENLQHALFIHDFLIPPHKFTHFIEEVFTQTQIAPLWICPIKTTSTPQYLSPHYHPAEEPYINVGVYGCPPGADSIPALSRHFEAYVDQIGGRKLLYSLNYYAEDEFWKTRNRPHYQELRQRYAAEGKIVDLYQKISRGFGKENY